MLPPPVLLLMFSQEDLVVKDVSDENYDYEKYLFITNVAQAKKRLDLRGLDIFACKQFFYEMRADRVYKSTPVPSELDPENPDDLKLIIEFIRINKGGFIENPINFDDYLQILKKAYLEVAKKGEQNPLFVHKKDAGFELITDRDFFHPDAQHYYGEVLDYILCRCFLEVVPEQLPVILDMSDLIDTYLEKEGIFTLIEDGLKEIRYQVELDYRVYGFILEEDPTLNLRLRKRLTSLNEDQFIVHVLHPLLEKMGYKYVRRVTFHGRNEFGSDILPFRYRNPLGTFEYYAVQAKATDIHGTSARSGNAAELISQAIQAFKVTFIDDFDNERKRIDKFIIATNKNITVDARRFIEEATEGDRKLIFLDIDRIIAMVKEHHLLQYILFADLQ
jgi:hypothetical protein